MRITGDARAGQRFHPSGRWPALAMGTFRRLAALTLIGSIIPTTYAGHRFWEQTDQAPRVEQNMAFCEESRSSRWAYPGDRGQEGELRRMADEEQFVWQRPRSPREELRGSARRRSETGAARASEASQPAIRQTPAASGRAEPEMHADASDSGQKMARGSEGL